MDFRKSGKVEEYSLYLENLGIVMEFDLDLKLKGKWGLVGSLKCQRIWFGPGKVSECYVILELRRQGNWFGLLKVRESPRI